MISYTLYMTSQSHFMTSLLSIYDITFTAFMTSYMDRINKEEDVKYVHTSAFSFTAKVCLQTHESTAGALSKVVNIRHSLLMCLTSYTLPFFSLIYLKGPK